ncbi:hypothetical protein PTSG_13199, partial [Salpingoeca rosetta]
DIAGVSSHMAVLVYSISACFTVLNLIWFQAMMFGENAVVRRLRSRSALKQQQKKNQ